MIKIFLLWTLLNGQPVDVDAFASQDQCLASAELGRENLKKALSSPQGDQVKGIALIGCQPVETALPAADLPQPRKESM